MLKKNAKEVAMRDDSKGNMNVEDGNQSNQESKQKQEEPTEKNELEWKVKKSTITNYDEDGESIQSISTSEYEYDENGNILRGKTTDDIGEGRYIYTYDIDNRLTAFKLELEYKESEEDGSLEIQIEWEKEGKNFDGTVYVGESQIGTKIKEKYDEENRLVEFSVLDEEGNVSFVLKYDTGGNLVYNQAEDYTEEWIYEKNRIVNVTRMSDNSYSFWNITELNDEGWVTAEYSYESKVENVTESDLPEPYSYIKYEYGDGGTVRKGTKYDKNGIITETLIEERIQLPKARSWEEELTAIVWA